MKSHRAVHRRVVAALAVACALCFQLGAAAAAAHPAHSPTSLAGRRLRVLIAPMPGGASHAMVIGRLAGELASRANSDVTLLVPSLVAGHLTKVAPAGPTLTHIPFAAPGAAKEMGAFVARLMSRTGPPAWHDWRARVGPFGHMAAFATAFGRACVDVVRNETLLAALDAAGPFDVVLGDRMDTCPPAIITALAARPAYGGRRAPLVAVHAGTATDPWLDVDGARYGPSSTSSMNLAVWGGGSGGAGAGHPRPPGSLGWRVANALDLALERALLTFEVHPAGPAVRAAIGFPDPPSAAAVAPVLTVINSDWAIDWPRAVPPNILLAGGFLPGPPAPGFKMEPSLGGWLAAKAPPHTGPVVYAATGSIFSHGPAYSASLVEALLNVTGALHGRLLIKLTEAEMDDATVAALPADRVRVVRWAPQNEVLATGAVALFLSHGGASSTFESLYHGVPLVVLPCSAEQPANAARVAAAGAGLALPQRAPVPAVAAAVGAALADLPALTAGARAASLKMRAGRRPAAAVAAEAVEHIAALSAAGVDPAYLRPSAALDAPWAVRTGVDVAAVLVGGVAGVVALGTTAAKAVAARVKSRGAPRPAAQRVSAGRKRR